MRKLSLLYVLIIIVLQSVTTAQAASTPSLNTAFSRQLSDVQVLGHGTVIRILKDDNKGSTHQKFILRVSENHTILIAHNIDLAPRINSISKGDHIKFYGEYEWNKRGGVVHWTHRDPNGRHQGGWLKHRGKTYQ